MDIPIFVWISVGIGLLLVSWVMFLVWSNKRRRRRWREVRGDVKGFSYWVIETALTHLSVIGVFFVWQSRESAWSGLIALLCIVALIYVSCRQWFGIDPRWRAMLTEILMNFPEADLEADFDTRYEFDGTLTLIPYSDTRSIPSSVLDGDKDIPIPPYGPETMLFIYGRRNYTDGQYGWKVFFAPSLYGSKGKE